MIKDPNNNHGGLITYVNDNLEANDLCVRNYSSVWENLFVRIKGTCHSGDIKVGHIKVYPPPPPHTHTHTQHTQHTHTYTDTHTKITVASTICSLLLPNWKQFCSAWKTQMLKSYSLEIILKQTISASEIIPRFGKIYLYESKELVTQEI